MDTTLVSDAKAPTRTLAHELILRLALPLGMVSLAMMILLGVLAEKRERAGVGQSLTRAAARMTGALDANFTERVDNVTLLASLEAMQAPVDARAARKVFDSLLGRQQAFAWLGRLDGQGVILAASGGLLQGQSGAQRPVFIEGRKGLFVGDVHEALLLAKLLPAPNSGEPLRFIDIALPIYRPDGTFDGVLATHLSWPWVRSLFDQMLQDFDRVRGLDLLILDRHGKVLAGPAELEGKPLILPGLHAPSAQGLTGWGQAVWPDQQDYVFAYADSVANSQVGRLGWRVLVRQPSTQALAPVRQLHLQLAVSVLVLALMLGGLGWVLARRIARPLANMAVAARQIAEGEEVSIQTGSRLREVEALAGTLQHMVDTLTHREQALDHMHTLAHRDALSGLHNRRALELHMSMAAERAVRSGDCFAVLALDLDGFKPVNDQYGHAVGDALLREVAQRLNEVVRASEMLARIGGDEFVVLLCSPLERLPLEAQAVANRILKCFEPAFTAAGHTLSLGCSIGIALGANTSDTPQSLLPRADQALYAAKRNGRGQIAWNGTLAAIAPATPQPAVSKAG